MVSLFVWHKKHSEFFLFDMRWKFVILLHFTCFCFYYIFIIIMVTTKLINCFISQINIRLYFCEKSFFCLTHRFLSIPHLNLLILVYFVLWLLGFCFALRCLVFLDSWFFEKYTFKLLLSFKHCRTFWEWPYAIWSWS